MIAFGIPMTVEQLRAHQGLNPDGTEMPSEDDGLPPAAEIDNGSSPEAEPTPDADGRYTFDHPTYGPIPGLTLDGYKQMEIELAEDLAAAGEQPTSGNERIIASELANDEALRELLQQLELGELSLSTTGILGAIFGEGLTEALQNDALINEVLALFDLTREDYDEENSGEETPAGDLPDSSEIGNEEPGGLSDKEWFEKNFPGQVYNPPEGESGDLPNSDEINNESPAGDQPEPGDEPDE